NGISEKNEIRCLSQLGITRLDTRFNLLVGNRNISPFGNVVRFVGKYYGPAQCKNKGCNIYDVYFSVTSSESLAKAK
ncbi:MAG: hypothetical protein HQK54_14390, partial [Oligoflexales bacterium]|nr:hypothetical protein [Oligoflexales bacterium]